MTIESFRPGPFSTQKGPGQKPMLLTRDNETWIRDLAREGRRQTNALYELQGVLLRGLAKSLQANGRVNRAFLEDVVQETLVRILANLDSFEGKSRFTTWAMSIAVRMAMSSLRRKHWRDVSLEDVGQKTGMVPELENEKDLSPDQQAEQQMIITTLQGLIDKQLTRKQKLAIQAELAGMPIEEIASRLDSNSNAVYKLLHDARKRLKAELERRGYSVEVVRSAFS